MDDFVDTGQCDGLLGLLLVRAGVPDEDVVTNRAVEEVRMLEDHADLCATGGRVQSGDIGSVDQYLATLRFLQAGDERQDGAFPRARRTDDGGGGARFEGEVDAPEYVFARVAIAEGHIAELDTGAGVWAEPGAGAGWSAASAVMMVLRRSNTAREFSTAPARSARTVKGSRNRTTTTISATAWGRRFHRAPPAS